MSPNSDSKTLWLSLHKIIYKRPHLAKHIILRAASIEDLFSKPLNTFCFESDDERNGFEAIIKCPDFGYAEETLKRCSRLGLDVITIEDPIYPLLLRETNYPPPILFVKGWFPDFKVNPAIGVVGSRKMTSYGREMAENIAGELAKAGFVIVSGLAYGIDVVAHKAALKEKGLTIGVLGSGFGLFYPKVHERLAEDIKKCGAVISEFPLDEEPFRGNFPMRNRIISGISLGVLVVEAAINSGSLITAGWAADQGREVFAVPGQVGMENSKGVHKLIGSGAKLVESYEDIIDVLRAKIPPSISPEKKNPRHLEAKNANERAILKALAGGEATSDMIAERAEMKIQDVIAHLTEMECRSMVKRIEGGRYARGRFPVL